MAKESILPDRLSERLGGLILKDEQRLAVEALMSKKDVLAVIFGSAEQALSKEFRDLLKDELSEFGKNLSLVVVDECNTAQTSFPDNSPMLGPRRNLKASVTKEKAVPLLPAHLQFPSRSIRSLQFLPILDVTDRRGTAYSLPLRLPGRLNFLRIKSCFQKARHLKQTKGRSLDEIEAPPLKVWMRGLMAQSKH